jgi:stage IV sporulation protein FB
MTPKQLCKRLQMQFKIKRTSVKVSFSFLALVLLFAVTEKFNIYLLSLLCSAIHESAHVVAILLFGGEISSISLSALGGNISRENTKALSPVMEGVICICAPILNILLYFIFICVEKYTLFAQVNLVIGVFNLLPFYSFDGGAFLRIVLTEAINDSLAERVITICSVVISVLFTAFSIYSYFYISQNILLVIFSLFMVLSMVLKK